MCPALSSSPSSTPSKCVISHLNPHARFQDKSERTYCGQTPHQRKFDACTPLVSARDDNGFLLLLVSIKMEQALGHHRADDAEGARS